MLERINDIKERLIRFDHLLTYKKVEENYPVDSKEIKAAIEYFSTREQYELCAELVKKLKE